MIYFSTLIKIVSHFLMKVSYLSDILISINFPTLSLIYKVQSAGEHHDISDISFHSFILQINTEYLGILYSGPGDIKAK